MKFGTYLLFLLLFGILPDIYLCGMLAQESPWWALAAGLPTLLAVGCVPFMKSQRYYTEAVRLFSHLIFLFLLPKALFTLFAFPASLSGAQWPVVVGAAVGIGVSIFFFVMIFGVSRHLVVRETKISLEGLPAAFNGLRLCHISDLHLGSFGPRSRFVQKALQRAQEAGADLICFTGDLVNFASREALPYREPLGKLTAPLGVFSIPGNHDYLLHGPFQGDARAQEMQKLLDMEQQELHWTLLNDAHVVLRRGKDSLALAGVGNVAANPLFQAIGGHLDKALEGIPEGMFTILLSHDPTHWRREVLPNSKVALMLSGHTHGLRYKLAGLHPSHWRLHESGGLYREGSRALYVSEGLGSAFAFRLGGFPKIDILTLTNTKNI